MNFDLMSFAETNDFTIDDFEQARQLQTAIDASEPVGFVTKGAIEGMIPSSLMAVGTNSIFPYGISVNLRKEDAAQKCTAYLIPKCIYVNMESLTINDIVPMKEVVHSFLHELGIAEQAWLGVCICAEKGDEERVRKLQAALEPEGLTLKTFTNEEAQSAAEQLSEIDKLIGKTASDTLNERLARLSGKQMTKEQIRDRFAFALSEAEWKVSFL